ncbi:hypothetical protein J7T55_001526 [Diaporthe amygdali]|uniref:uncharacterized protein n=1 Tax=Phomopsis amygdali TaxID=1214568 RepID=UPI0022FDF878|nr:uncharacterized protein J7T55_001526 [Diaporthe amygdali]KAJ0115117.1 hypothetical protein J7T55_001526 [Diaporthe amygdali]
MDDQIERVSKCGISPDGVHVALLCIPRDLRSDEPQVWGHNWNYSRLYLFHIHTGAVTHLVDGESHVTDFAWDDHGTKIVAITHRTPHIESVYLHGSKIIIFTLQEQLNSSIKRGSVEMTWSFPGEIICVLWSLNTIHIIARNQMNFSASGQCVYLLPIEKGVEVMPKDTDLQLAPIKKSTTYGSDCCPVRLLKLKNDVVVHVQRGLEDQLRSLRDGKIIFTHKKRIVAFDVVVPSPRSQDRLEIYKSELVLATAHGDVNNPTEVFSMSFNETDDAAIVQAQLSDHGANFKAKFNYLSSHRAVNCVFLKCPSLDCTESLEGVYYVPGQPWKPASEISSKPAKPFSTIVLLHGGPYSRITDAFDIWNPFHILTPALLQQGYGILWPNYRGSSGRGQKFASYAAGGMGTFDESDIVAMTQHVVVEGYADEQRLLVAGWSQGGYLTYLSAMRNGLHGFGWKFKAAIAGAGITDWDSLTLSSDLGYSQAILAGGAPWSSLDKGVTTSRSGSALWEFLSAVKNPTGNRIPPIMILHGESDERVPISQAQGMRRALDGAGLPFEFVPYPGEGNHFTQRRHIVDMMARILGFLEYHLR